jgi:hypothetical protein
MAVALHKIRKKENGGLGQNVPQMEVYKIP